MGEYQVSKMIEVKAAELTEAALDWAVAQAEGVNVTLSRWRGTGNMSCWLADNPRTAFHPSNTWRQGGWVVERNWLRASEWLSANLGSDWPEKLGGQSRGILLWFCRAAVAIKLGDTVQVPAELMEVPE